MDIPAFMSPAIPDFMWLNLVCASWLKNNMCSIYLQNNKPIALNPHLPPAYPKYDHPIQEPTTTEQTHSFKNSGHTKFVNGHG
jgi:hypothetical protein